MAIYELTFRGVMAGQALNNVFKYQTTAGSFDIIGMVNTLGLAFENVHSLATVDDLTMTAVHIRRLDAVEPGFDHIPSSWPYSGTLTGQYVSTFQAVSMRMTGSVLAFPYKGFKRFAGISEADIIDGELTAGSQTLWDDVAQVIVNPVIGGLGETWNPILYTDTYPTPNVVGSIVVDSLVTTQNTRKIGRGG